MLPTYTSSAPAFGYQEFEVICMCSDNYMIMSYCSQGGDETGSNMTKFFERAPQEREGRL